MGGHGQRLARRPLVMAIVAAALLVPAAARSQPSGTVVKTFRLPPGYAYDAAPGMGAMWLFRDDEANTTLIYRVDPRRNKIDRVAQLPFPSGGVAVGYHSLWVTDYYGDALYRLSPSGKVRARIPTGLQPQYIHLGLGSVWVSNHHSHSVTRIDLATDRVIATDRAGAWQFRDGPQALADDGHMLYVGSSNLQKLQRISPATDRTSTPPGQPLPDNFCQELDFADGWIWSDDVNCTDSVYRLNRQGRIIQTISYGGRQGGVGSMTVLRNVVWIGDDQHFDPSTGSGSDAALKAYSASTGRSLCTRQIGGDATTLAHGFGDLWVFDSHRATVRRIHVNPSSCG